MGPEVIVDTRDALANRFVPRFEALVRDAGRLGRREATRFVVAIRDSPEPPPARITLTLVVSDRS